MKAGLSFVYSQNVILGVIIMEAMTSIFGLDNAILTIFASDILRVGAQGFGLLQSARGLGAVIGSSSVISPSASALIRAKSCSSRRCFTARGSLSSVWRRLSLLALLLLTFVGAVDTIWGIGAQHNSAVARLPTDLRGRVMGIFQLSNQGLNPLGQVETGLLVPVVGARAATTSGRTDRFRCDACDGFEAFRIAPLQPRRAAPRAKTRRSSLRRPRIVENIFRLSEIRRQHMRQH